MNGRKQTNDRMRNLNRGRFACALLACFALLLCLVPAYANVGDSSPTWEEYAKEMRILEEEIGFYVDWPIAEKENLIRALVDMGHIKPSDRTEQLFHPATSEEAKHQTADEIMTELLGGDDDLLVRKDGIAAVRWDAITIAILGDKRTWTPAQHAWFQQVTNMYRTEKDPDTFVVPGEADLPVETVIAIAKEAVINAYDLPQNALDDETCTASLILYVTEYTDEPRPDYRRWNVSLQTKNDDSDFLYYYVIVDENGFVIRDSELGFGHIQENALKQKTKINDQTPEVIRTFREYAEYEGCFFPWQWSWPLKAFYSQEVRAQVQAALQANDLTVLVNTEQYGDPIQEIIASTEFAYGLPQDNHIPESDALQSAKRLLNEEHGLHEEMLERFDVYSSFDVTAPNKPLWKFLFCPHSFENMEQVLLYKVELHAESGEVVETHILDWQMLFKDELYDRMLY